jgi:Tfp pilus assembly protein PilF
MLGAALAWLGDLDNAALSLQHAVAMQPGHVDAQEFLAAVARAKGDGPRAAEAERKAVELRTQLSVLGVEGRRIGPPWGAGAWERKARAGA